VEAPALDGIAGHVGAIAKPSSQPLQAALLRAELAGDQCTAAGLTARGSTPVIALCRELVVAGFNPAATLEAWRGQTLCLRVRSIGEAAKLEPSPRGAGFVRRPGVRGSPPIAYTGRAFTVGRRCGGGA
jgi:hypothetical protein